MEPEPTLPLTDLERARMSAERSALYNVMRRNHLRRRGWGAVALALVAGAVLEGHPAALAVAFVTLVYGVRTIMDSREHDGTAREFDALVARSHGAGFHPSEVAAESAGLWAREPAGYHAVNALAYNAVQDAHERDPASRLVIPRFRVLTAHWLPWLPGMAFPARPTKAE